MPRRHIARRTKHEQAGRLPYRTFVELGLGCIAPPSRRRANPFGAGFWSVGLFHFHGRGTVDDNGDVLRDEPKPWDHTVAVGCRDKRDVDLAVSNCSFAVAETLWFMLDCNLLPKVDEENLATTNYAITASVQLMSLLVFRTPSGITWWEASGAALTVIICVYATA